MSEILNALRADLLTAIDGLDVGEVVSDVRNIRPPCLLIGIPTVTRVNTLTVSTISVDMDVDLLAPGPGNADAVEWLLARIVPLMEALRVDTATPVVREIGERSFPAYNLPLNRVLTITPEGS